MSVKTLGSAPSVANPARRSSVRTYSIEPSLPLPTEIASPARAEFELFLEAENPIGCFRGVMWVMAFNVAVFLLGLAIWQSCKFLF